MARWSASSRITVGVRRRVVVGISDWVLEGVRTPGTLATPVEETGRRAEQVVRRLVRSAHDDVVRLPDLPASFSPAHVARPTSRDGGRSRWSRPFRSNAGSVRSHRIVAPTETGFSQPSVCEGMDERTVVVTGAT